MKKKLLIIGAGILVLGGVFLAGNMSGKAGSSWGATAENTAYSELMSTGYQTKDGLVQNLETDVNEKVNTAIQGTVDEQQKILEQLLNEYYQMKLDGLTESDQFKQLEQRIKDIQTTLLSQFKVQIDQEFANLNTQQ